MTDTRWFGHPRGLSTLFFTEMWERFSYYGMRAILVLFMTSAVTTGGMGLDDVTATAIYGIYTAAVYVVALPGGWIADRVLHRPHAHRYRHRTAEAKHQRDRRGFVSRRRRAARRRIFDLLHGHQPRRVPRTPGVRIPGRSYRLASWFRRGWRRHGIGTDPVLARRTASRPGRRIETGNASAGDAQSGETRAPDDPRRCRRACLDHRNIALDRCDSTVARRLRRLD